MMASVHTPTTYSNLTQVFPAFTQQDHYGNQIEAYSLVAENIKPGYCASSEGKIYQIYPTCLKEIENIQTKTGNAVKLSKAIDCKFDLKGCLKPVYRKKMFRVDDLIYQSIIKGTPLDKGFAVGHKDGNLFNNSAINLELRMATKCRESSHSASGKDNNILVAIYNLTNQTKTGILTLNELIGKLGIRRDVIIKICNRGQFCATSKMDGRIYHFKRAILNDKNQPVYPATEEEVRKEHLNVKLQFKARMSEMQSKRKANKKERQLSAISSEESEEDGNGDIFA